MIENIDLSKIEFLLEQQNKLKETELRLKALELEMFADINKLKFTNLSVEVYITELDNIRLSLGGVKNKNSYKICKWSHADWCHHPDDEYQEKCSFYFENYKCPKFEEKK